MSTLAIQGTYQGYTVRIIQGPTQGDIQGLKSFPRGSVRVLQWGLIYKVFIIQGALL